MNKNATSQNEIPILEKKMARIPIYAKDVRVTEKKDIFEILIPTRELSPTEHTTLQILFPHTMDKVNKLLDVELILDALEIGRANR